jgi:hypothetical protein
LKFSFRFLHFLRLADDISRLPIRAIRKLLKGLTIRELAATRVSILRKALKKSLRRSLKKSLKGSLRGTLKGSLRRSLKKIICIRSGREIKKIRISLLNIIIESD